jgi:hypothetical protein
MVEGDHNLSIGAKVGGERYPGKTNPELRIVSAPL